MKIGTFSCAILQVLIITNSYAQQIGTPTWNDTPTDVQIFTGWDWTGMTDEEVQASLGILYPDSEQDIMQSLTLQQQQLRTNSILSITNPEEYSRQFSYPKSPEQLADQAFHRWAIENPREYESLARSVKTADELREDTISLWMITHPVEASAMAQRSKTAEEVEAQNKATAESALVLLKPSPILKSVPFWDAGTVFNESLQNSQPAKH